MLSALLVKFVFPFRPVAQTCLLLPCSGGWGDGDGDGGGRVLNHTADYFGEGGVNLSSSNNNQDESVLSVIKPQGQLWAPHASLTKPERDE